MFDKVVCHKGGADKEAEAMRQKILNAVNELPKAFGKTYYVSENGDDSNDGLSPETAIKTYHHIANLPLKAGDEVLLKRGDTFRITERLWLIDGVNYGAYGEGDKPFVLGSLRDYADPKIWKQSTENPNIWQTEIHGEDRASLTTFNNDTYVGVWKYKIEDLEKDGDFAHDEQSGIYSLYFSNGNPGEYFNNIEIATTITAVRTAKTAGHRNNHVDNIYFKYFTFGAFLAAEADNFKITNCVCGWQGGKIYDANHAGGVKQYGNAIQFWWQCRDIWVNNCWIYQIFDAAITFQGSGPGPTWFTNINFDYNLIEYCSMNIEYWAGTYKKVEPNVDAHIDGISYKGNIIRFGGYGWAGVQRWDKHCQALFLSWNHVHNDLSNFVITENILDCADCYFVWMKGPETHKGMSAYGNTYYQKKPSGNNKNNEIIYHGGKKANNQAEFEDAIKFFEKEPKKVEWLDI